MYLCLHTFCDGPPWDNNYLKRMVLNIVRHFPKKCGNAATPWSGKNTAHIESLHPPFEYCLLTVTMFNN